MAHAGGITHAVAEHVAQHRPHLVDLRSGAAEVAAAAGFVHGGRNGAELLFTPAKFRELVCAGLGERTVLAALGRRACW